jgi:hypothetical protein
MYISAGNGILKIATDSDLTFIIEDMKPELRAGNYDKAVERGIVALGLLLSGDPKFRSQYKGKGGGSGGFTSFLNNDVAQKLLLVIALAAFASAVSPSPTESRLEKGRKKLDQLAREVSQSEIEDVYQPHSCPICMEDYPAADRRTYYDSRQMNNEMASDKADNDGSAKKSIHRPMALQCGHVFCWSCLDGHLKSPQGKNCPICNESVIPRSLPVRDDMYRTNPSYFSDRREWARWRNREYYYRINRLNEM